MNNKGGGMDQKEDLLIDGLLLIGESSGKKLRMDNTDLSPRQICISPLQIHLMY